MAVFNLPAVPETLLCVSAHDFGGTDHGAIGSRSPSMVGINSETVG